MSGKNTFCCHPLFGACVNESANSNLATAQQLCPVIHATVGYLLGLQRSWKPNFWELRRFETFSAFRDSVTELRKSSSVGWQEHSVL